MVSASDLDSIMNLNGQVQTEVLEQIIDLAIDTLNLYGTSLSNMTGDAGSKEVTLTSKEKAAVFIVARAIYYGFYKDLGTAGITSGGLTVTSTDLMRDPATLALIKEVALMLTQQQQYEPDGITGIVSIFQVGQDTSGIE